MTDFVLIHLNERPDQLEAFAQLGQIVRANDFKVGAVGVEQVKNLVQFGMAMGGQFWLLQEVATGKCIGRLGANILRDQKEMGTIGFFEIDVSHNEVQRAFDLLINEAQRWLKGKGISKIAAPVDINTWFNYRFSLPGKSFFPRFKWEPTTPPEYLALFTQAGYESFSFYHTTIFPYFRIGSFCWGYRRMKKYEKKLYSLGFSLKPLDIKNVELLYDISHDAFEGQFMFERLNLDTFSMLYTVSAKLYDSSPSFMLYDQSNTPVGFILAFYDGDYLVIKSLALRKKIHGLGISEGLVSRAVGESFKRGKKGAISALVRNGIASDSIEKKSHSETWFIKRHEYVLLSKNI